MGLWSGSLEPQRFLEPVARQIGDGLLQRSVQPEIPQPVIVLGYIVVQSLSRAHSLPPHGLQRTISRNLLKLISMELVMLSSHLIIMATGN